MIEHSEMYVIIIDSILTDFIIISLELGYLSECLNMIKMYLD